MQIKRSIPWMLSVGFFIAGCATSADSVAMKEKKNRSPRTYEIDHPQRLSDFLVRVPGVILDYRTGVPQILIRGGYPLYIVDGVRLGHSYMSAASLVNVQDIASVEVLKSPGEALIYGRDASYGAIVIRTKVGRVGDAETTAVE